MDARQFVHDGARITPHWGIDLTRSKPLLVQTFEKVSPLRIKMGAASGHGNTYDERCAWSYRTHPCYLYTLPELWQGIAIAFWRLAVKLIPIAPAIMSSPSSYSTPTPTLLNVKVEVIGLPLAQWPRYLPIRPLQTRRRGPPWVLPWTCWYWLRKHPRTTRFRRP